MTNIHSITFWTARKGAEPPVGDYDKFVKSVKKRWSDRLNTPDGWLCKPGERTRKPDQDSEANR